MRSGSSSLVAEVPPTVLVSAATPRMLSRQLKEREADGIVHRELYPVVPPKTEHSPTDLGQTLAPPINDRCDWGYAYFERAGVPAPEENINPLTEAAGGGAGSSPPRNRRGESSPAKAECPDA